MKNLTSFGSGARAGSARGYWDCPNSRGLGRQGAIRIIWGPNRAFPSTNTQDL